MKKTLIKITLGFLIALGVWALLYAYAWKDQDRNRVLSVLAWQGSFSREVIERFEKETGILVHLNHYATNEELLAKLHLTNGTGIDIIVPSDYLVERLQKEGFIQSLEDHRIKAVNDLYKNLVDHVRSENKLWAVPLEWGMYGMGVHPQWYNRHKNDTDLFSALFAPYELEEPARICMTNDSPAACMAAYLHVGKSDHDINYESIFNFLKKQRPFVVAYSDGKIGHMLAAGEVDVAYMQSDEFLRTCSFMPDLKFFLHSHGSLKTVEYAALSSQSKHAEEAYEFLNFMLSKEIMEINMSSLCYLPTRSDLADSSVLLPEAREILNFVHVDNYRLISAFDVLSEDERLKLWVQLKS